MPNPTVYAERGTGVEDEPLSKCYPPNDLASLRRQMWMDHSDAAMPAMSSLSPRGTPDKFSLDFSVVSTGALETRGWRHG